MTLDVGIVGAGTAGSAAALFLRRAGHRVTLYERVAQPAAVGAGVVLQPSGMAALERLGLREGVVSRGARLDGLHVQTSRGRTVLDLHYASLDPASFGVGLHRGVLFDALHGALDAYEIPVHRGVEVHAIRAADPRNGRSGRRTLQGADGSALGSYDLVVVADGARSHLRSDTSIRANVQTYPWGALWFVARDPDSTVNRGLFQVVEGARRMLGLLPTGVGTQGETPLVSVFFSIALDEVNDWRARGVESFREECIRLTPRSAPFVAQIRTMDDLTLATYQDVVMPSWNTRSVVYLGDAAHATSPQLGQGCNLALVDAAALADCLAEMPHLPTALDAYSRSRRDHLSFYQHATRLLTPFFQSDHGALALLRDTFMGPACKIPFVRNEMVRSMTGMKTSWIFRS